MNQSLPLGKTPRQRNKLSVVPAEREFRVECPRPYQQRAQYHGRRYETTSLRAVGKRIESLDER